MNDTELVPKLNEILGTDYAALKFFTTAQLTRACLILQVKQLLAEHPNFEITQDARVSLPFGELPEGSVFRFQDESDVFVKQGGLAWPPDHGASRYVCTNTRVVFLSPPTGEQ